MMECWDAVVSYTSWALVIGGLAYLLRQTQTCAEYGRYVPAQAWCCSAKLGWFLQEVPSFLLPLLLLFTAEPEPKSETGRRLLVCTFMLHYFHRSIIYAFLTRGRPIPLFIVASSVIFCSLNGFMQGHFLLHCFRFEDTWLTYARLTAGFLVFVLGMIINIHSDHILRSLRKPGEVIYRVPHGTLLQTQQFLNKGGPHADIFPQGECLSLYLGRTSSAKSWSGVVTLWPSGLSQPSPLLSSPSAPSGPEPTCTTEITSRSSRTTLAPGKLSSHSYCNLRSADFGDFVTNQFPIKL